MNKTNPTRPKYLLMLLAAGGLMFNVACTEDGIDGLPGGFGSGQDTAEIEIDIEIDGDDVLGGGGYVIPEDDDIWQGENNYKKEDGE